MVRRLVLRKWLRQTCSAIVLALGASVSLFSAPAAAGVWPEMGDAQTRSDIEMAVAAGLLDNITTQGPQPWTGVVGRLQDANGLGFLPADVRDAVARLQEEGAADLNLHRPHVSVSLDFTNDPATVRGYDALGRAHSQGQASYEYLSTDTAVHLSIGTQLDNARDKRRFVLDGSYIAHRIDDIVVYAGYKEHWWGPGWISALSLSTNAPPIPQIGFSRVHSRQSDSWWLHWLGPWQFEAFVGLLDDTRIARNTGLIGLHFAFNPLPGLEVGLSRTTQMCGSGHPCQPLVEYFTFSNDPSHVNQTNEEASIEFRYTNMLFSRPFALYVQFMNEDTGPITHSSTSHLYGGSVWLPFEDLRGRLTLEYANSIATNNIWGGGAQYGVSYNNSSYIDGMRYRGRTLGFSLDCDSVLYSAQVSVTDRKQRTLSLTYHRALVSNPLNTSGNVVTSAPVRFNAVEARLTVPFQWGDYRARIDTAGRWQDDQPRPKRGSQVAFELALKFGL